MEDILRYYVITPPQIAALELAEKAELVQYKGGRWALKKDADRNPEFWLEKPVPIQVASTLTVMALKRRGWLEGTWNHNGRKPVRLTQLGRECLNREKARIEKKA